MSTDTRIYVACLASYNSGVLHGAWIDCEGKDAGELQDEVSAMLRASPYPNVEVDCPDCPPVAEDEARRYCTTCKGTGKVPSAEEFAIHDHEGFGDLIGEFTPLERVAFHAEMIGKHGDAWSAYCSDRGEADADEENFEEAYSGTWDSERAFAENLLDDMGEIKGDSLAERYFDYDAFTRDLFMFDYWRDDATGAVFNRNC